MALVAPKHHGGTTRHSYVSSRAGGAAPPAASPSPSSGGATSGPRWLAMPAAKPLFFNERIGFSGHETFPFRTAWLKKAVDAVTADPRVFTRDDAFVVLGVGKNMVRSIRH